MNKAGTGAVLVVDDDENVCRLISGMLKKRGFRTAVAGNGRVALAYLKKTRRPPGLILLDLMMPEMTGWEFRRIQQGDPKIAHIPVAIITGMENAAGNELGFVLVNRSFFSVKHDRNRSTGDNE